MCRLDDQREYQRILALQTYLFQQCTSYDTKLDISLPYFFARLLYIIFVPFKSFFFWYYIYLLQITMVDLVSFPSQKFSVNQLTVCTCDILHTNIFDWCNLYYLLTRTSNSITRHSTCFFFQTILKYTCPCSISGFISTVTGFRARRPWPCSPLCTSWVTSF